jgi:hypothetical protein
LSPSKSKKRVSLAAKTATRLMKEQAKNVVLKKAERALWFLQHLGEKKWLQYGEIYDEVQRKEWNYIKGLME